MVCGFRRIVRHVSDLLYSVATKKTRRCDNRYPAMNPPLLPLQHSLSADDGLIISRQTVEHGDTADVLRRRLLEQVVEDLRGEVVRRVVITADSCTQLLHR